MARRGGFVISDEIHAPLAHTGRAFTPYLTVSEEARQDGIAAESGSTSFGFSQCADDLRRPGPDLTG